MGKMQLLDESHILIKYTAYPLSSDTNTQSFIMVYNMDTTEVNLLEYIYEKYII